MMRKLAVRAGLMVLMGAAAANAQRLDVPRAQDRPPGPPLSPQEAIARMTVPENFSVEVIAAEPDVVNPVAMCIDEKGRYWITESFEYPRREPGPGRDRIKVLEDTDGDGKVDRTTVFAEGLNIPSGIAVGHGGVWVANAPDILFLQDTDGDLKADKTEVVVTGFGRTDTHELPNSFTWGPDGWLYGLNGVFNYCDVDYSKTNPNFREDHPGWKFTCALFRIHPKTREFQIWAEGTSNPWGIAINENGDFFLSACVIDHLWHLVENGYYIRQGGPYPPHTWPMESIVEHKHQKAAYCGITWFDSDAYPDQYRRVLYMGNIHGGCINADVLERSGATYRGKPHPGFTAKAGAWDHDQYNEIRKRGSDRDPKLADLLTANDPWFMPVVQKTGPDGCLCILDWYDRYHCYQDANADPEGIERAKGRLYRVRYREARRAKPFDLAKSSDDELIAMLGNANIFYRETAQRLLTERQSPALYDKLFKLATNKEAKLDNQIRHATFALSSFDLRSIERWLTVSRALLLCPDEFRQAWAVRCLTNNAINPKYSEAELSAMGEIALSALEDPSPVLRLQGAIFVGRLAQTMQSYVAFDEALAKSVIDFEFDPILPRAVWASLMPYVDRHKSVGAARRVASTAGLLQKPVGQEIVRRMLERSVDQRQFQQVADVLVAISADEEHGRPVAADVLLALGDDVQNGSIKDQDRMDLQSALKPLLGEVKQAGSEHALHESAQLLAASWADPDAVAGVEKQLSGGAEGEFALDSLRALISAGAPSAVEWAIKLLQSPAAEFQGQVLFAMSRLDDPRIGEAVLEAYERLPADVQPRALELLTQRPRWSASLLASIAGQKINKDSLNLNQLRRVASFKDEALQKQFAELYGTIREGRNPDREQVINQFRDFLHGTPGDPHAGHVVFKKVCAQCHKIYNEGETVGPDITLNGRNNWEQLVSNVLDPSLVIGNAYQARVVATTDGRVLTGLPVEESDERVILKVQGGKLETIPRDEIEDFKVSELSMMPEQLEKQLTPQEIADLFAFLALDKPPTDPSGKILSGAPRQKSR